MDLDRDFCKHFEDLSFKGRFRTFLANFYFVSTKYEWFKKLGQRTTLKVHSFSNNFCRNVQPRQWEIGFNMTMLKKTGKQDVKNFIEIGWVEADKMTV